MGGCFVLSTERGGPVLCAKIQISFLIFFWKQIYFGLLLLVKDFCFVCYLGKLSIQLNQTEYCYSYSVSADKKQSARTIRR